MRCVLQRKGGGRQRDEIHTIFVHKYDARGGNIPGVTIPILCEESGQRRGRVGVRRGRERDGEGYEDCTWMSGKA